MRSQKVGTEERLANRQAKLLILSGKVRRKQLVWNFAPYLDARSYLFKRTLKWFFLWTPTQKLRTVAET
jgi:hypothetical protein